MSLFTGKTLMITGGTGSFGNVVLNRFLKTDIAGMIGMRLDGKWCHYLMLADVFGLESITYNNGGV